MNQITINPLTESEYADVFKVFSERSHEYEVMLNQIVSIINNLDEKKIKILSIGSGTGYFDNMFLSKINKEFEYTCIEPNDKHISELKTNLKKYNSITINQEYFTETTKLNDTYDIIIFSHSLYPINNPYESILNASKYITKKGKIVIFHQTNTGMCPFVNKYYKLFKFIKPPLANHIFNINDIYEYISKNTKMTVTKKEIESYIDFKNLNDKDMDKMLSFFLQFDYSKLSKTLQTDMISEIEKNIQNNNYLHPTGILIIN